MLEESFAVLLMLKAFSFMIVAVAFLPDFPRRMLSRKFLITFD
jgi:hypothetical protein